MSEFPPNLITYLTNGFNARTADFVGAPIFQVPGDSGQTVSLGLVQKTYAIPDGFMVDGVASFKTTSMNTLLHTDSDFKAAFSLALSMKGGGSFRKIGLSAGFSGSLALSGHLFHAVDEDRFLSYAVQTVCQVERLSAKSSGNSQHGVFNFAVDALSDNFKAAVSALGESPTPSQWNEFFEVYGTHILIRGSLGGYFLVQTSTRKLEVQTDFAAEIGASLESGFNAKVASGSFNMEGAVKGSAYLDDVMSKATHSYACRGGMFSTELHYWALSCFRNPVLVPGIHGLPAPVMASITELFPAATQDAAEAALRQYLLDGHILDTPLTQNLNQAYMPEISSLVSVSLNAASNLAGYVDLKSGSRIVAQSSVTNTTFDQGAISPYGNVLAPVSAGQTYAAEVSGTSLTGSVCAYPMLNPKTFAPAVGPGHALPTIHLSSKETKQATSQAVEAPSDGILVVMANDGNSANNGVVGLLDQADSSTIAVTGCYTNALYNTFAAPVIGKTSYVLQGSMTYESDTAIAFYPTFYPFAGVVFGTPTQIAPGVVYPATTDGLLVGYLYYADPNDGPHASLNFYSGPVAAAEVLAKSPFTAATSVDATRIVAAGSVTKPVRRGEYFTAVLTQSFVSSSYPLKYAIRWYPLVPASE